MRRLLIPASHILLLAAFMCGCKPVGPDYKPPNTTIPDVWTRILKEERNANQTGSQAWWADFHDPDLNRLIEIAKNNNPDLKESYARIKESWQQRRVIAAALFPHSDLLNKKSFGLGTFDNSGINWNIGDSRSALSQADLGWEIDVFGGIRRQVESSTANYESTVEAWRDVHVMITAEVALHYITLRTIDARYAVSQRGQTIYQDIVNLTQTRLEEGVGAKIDVHESSARLKSHIAEMPSIENERAAIISKLSVLTGLYPSQLNQILKNTKPIPALPKSLFTGVPADLLRSRPDIRKAERRLQTQTALIGAATANLYPSLSLSGAITYERSITSGVTDLFRRDLGLGPTLRWRIFHACADIARIKEIEAVFEVELAVYEKTVLQAVAEVEEAMAGIHFETLHLAKLNSALVDYRKTSTLMTESYHSGLVDLRRLINARESALDTETQIVAARGRIAAHAVRLFKALGGGELPSPKNYPGPLSPVTTPPHFSPKNP